MDIVERLRGVKLCTDPAHGTGFVVIVDPESPPVVEMCTEAADLIESLRADNARLRNAAADMRERERRNAELAEIYKRHYEALVAAMAQYQGMQPLRPLVIEATPEMLRALNIGGEGE